MHIYTCPVPFKGVNESTDPKLSVLVMLATLSGRVCVLFACSGSMLSAACPCEGGGSTNGVIPDDDMVTARRGAANDGKTAESVMNFLAHISSMKFANPTAIMVNELPREGEVSIPCKLNSVSAKMVAQNGILPPKLNRRTIATGKRSTLYAIYIVVR